MATIRDVARLAGVSHGTVSNVVNGAKTVNSDIVRRVQQAIKELGYQPDLKARSLRISKTNLIGVVLPNMVDHAYSSLYEGIAEALRDSGYMLHLFLSHDKIDQEKSALRRLQEQRAEAILLVTCMPDETRNLETVAASGIQLVFLRRKPDMVAAHSFVELDESALLHYALTSLKDAGHRSFLLLTDKQNYSNEAQAAASFEQFMAEHRNSGITGSYQSCDFGKNNVFSACAAKFAADEIPDVVLTTHSEAVKMVQSAASLFCDPDKKQPQVYCFQDYCFSKGYAHGPGMLYHRDFYDMGLEAAKHLISALEKREPHIAFQKTLSALKEHSVPEIHIPDNKRPLRLCLLKCSSADATYTLARRYTALTGKPVEIVALPYETLNQRMVDQTLMDDFDIVQTNRPWLNSCVCSGMVLPLDPYISAESLEYPPVIMNAFSLVNGRLYSVPYMMGAQMLFYRKDLFNNLRYQRLYYEQYQQELRPPRTWWEFDRIAAFFTRSLNPESPVEYGTVMGAVSENAVYSYIPRLWELGCEVYDTLGNSQLSSRESVQALKQLQDLMRYCSPPAAQEKWFGQIQSFFNGEIAMINVYESHLIDGHRYANSRIMGKYDVALAPGPASVQGGWVLTLSAKTAQPEDAADFLRWFSASENIIPFNMLGGSNPGSVMLDTPELIAGYPWFPLACTALTQAKPMLPESAPIQQAVFEGIAGREIEKFLMGETSAENTLRNIAYQIAMHQSR